MPEASVIVCTHNPRRDYLQRVLAALRCQSISLDRWELLLIDNASEEKLSGEVDLSWHSSGRHIREDKPGLTPARLRGIVDSSAPLLVYVDDDNVLSPKYLEAALEIAVEFPKLGAWSGQVLPEFEIPPPSELKPYLSKLCLRSLERRTWSNIPSAEFLPFGAGMCVRRMVGVQYAEELRTNRGRMALDRVGQVLYCAGDLDLGMTSLAMGFGTGLFPELEVTHLIPPSRLNEPYFIKLVRDGRVSSVVFNHVWGLNKTSQECKSDRLLAFYKYWRSTPLQKKLTRAALEGDMLGRRLITEMHISPRGAAPGFNLGASFQIRAGTQQ